MGYTRSSKTLKADIARGKELCYHWRVRRNLRKTRTCVLLRENARLQNVYSHEIDKRNKNKTDKILTDPLGLLALQAFRYNLGKDNHRFQLALNSHLQSLKTNRQTNNERFPTLQLECTSKIFERHELESSSNLRARALDNYGFKVFG